MFAVISISNFHLQAVLRHEPELRFQPAALLRDDSPKSPVWQVTEAAQKLGVSPGISSTQAKARCARIAFRLRSVPQEQAAQEILLECAYAFAAYLESTAPGVCTLDLRGLPLLKAPDLTVTLENWGRKIVAALEPFHLAAQVGLGHTPALAWQAALGNASVRAVQDPVEFRRHLDLSHLCDSPQLLEILDQWGIRTAAALLALGKDNIAERLGPEGLKLFETAQADQIRPLNLTTPKQGYEEYFEFEEPIEMLEPLLFILRRFLDQLVLRVAQAFLVIEELTLSLHLDSGQVHARALKIPAATRDVEVLFRILHNYLETVRTESPVTALSLQARACPSETQQFQLFETAVRDPNRFYETVGRLAALLGPDRVGTPVRPDSHRPGAFLLEPVTLEAGKTQPRRTVKTPRARSGLLASATESDQGETRPLRGLSLRRFRPPLPTQVKLEDGQPLSVRNSRVRGEIVRSQGPYRMSGDWWEQLWAREEWDIQTSQGGLFRLVREQHQWFLEGAYD